MEERAPVIHPTKDQPAKTRAKRRDNERPARLRKPPSREEKMPAPTYIISRVADPIFAVVIGVSAAVTRINREEKSKGRTTNETIEAGLRYAKARYNA
ncbi:hypothetical protein O9K51_05427 [Purpureocillium lavendulum]|uniref:Uncharacterized protein n=1 Tax=Purpureocillium lavendulum TaxID=1247861 RepID=A0AB34FT72_9HYPO|nr:hypothetical protein O9K51_05427 [Purpureocillium lavendulum]